MITTNIIRFMIDAPKLKMENDKIKYLVYKNFKLFLTPDPETSFINIILSKNRKCSIRKSIFGTLLEYYAYILDTTKQSQKCKHHYISDEKLIKILEKLL